MATKGKYTRLLVGSSLWAYDFSSVSNALTVDMSTDRIEATAFQDSAMVSIAGNPQGTISQKGYAVTSLSDGSQMLEARLAAAINSDTELTVAALYMTETDACPAYVARATTAAGMTIDAPVDGLIALEGEWFQGQGIVRGKRVWQGTISGTGAQSSPAYIDLGAAGAAGGYAWIWVREITGTATDADILLQSDDNTGFTTPATEATFTFSAVGAQEQVLSGAVDRYLRISTSDLGGATSFVVTVVAAVSGVTY